MDCQQKEFLQIMKYSLQQPKFIEIYDVLRETTTYGPNQSWFSDHWLRASGCGPTSASFVFSYLAFTRPELRELYRGADLTRKEFVKQMESLSTYIVPGKMGVYKVEMYVDGATRFATEHGITLFSHTFPVDELQAGWRTDFKGLSEFVRSGLESDSPIGFLVLSKGKEYRLQDWHWITITEAEITDDQIIATATDEGRKITFDLGLWYQTSRRSGALVYFTTA